MRRPRVTPSVALAATVILSLSIVGLVFLAFRPAPQIAVTSSSTTLVSSTCIFPGQPMGVFLRVISDSNSSPIVGANVTGSYTFAYTCYITPPNSSTPTPQLTTSQSIQPFTTNNTEWYRFSAFNDGLYSLTVTYAGQSHDLAATGRPSIYTCAIIYLPSGNASVVYQSTACESVSTG